MTQRSAWPPETEIVDWTTRLKAGADGESPDPRPSERELQLKALELAASEVHNRSLIDWRRVRLAIEHENNLVNHRVTWLLLSQGALLATFSTLFSKWIEYAEAVSRSSPPSPPAADVSGAGPYLPIVLVILAVLGLAISINLRLSLKNAALQIFRLTVWWHSGPLSLLVGTQADPLTLSKLVSLYRRRDRGSRAAAMAAYNELHQYHPPLHLNHDVEWRLNETPRQFWQRSFSIETLPLYFLFTWVAALVGLVAQALRPNWDDLAKWATWIAAVAAVLLILGAVLFAGVTIGRRTGNTSRGTIKS